MNNIVEIAKDADINLSETDVSKKAEVGRGYITLSAGPFLPIFSGEYNIVAYETADFQEFSVIGTYRAPLLV
jgi:hypothetical protein